MTRKHRDDDTQADTENAYNPITWAVDQLQNGIRVQREPFEANGHRVEAFAVGTRFPKERLWHIEITFRDAVTGPLVIGDGRFLGLGVMAPTQG